VSLPETPGVRYRTVATAHELHEACLEEFPACDILLMAAAVADFRPAEAAERKLKKDTDAPDSIALEPTEDILSALAAQRRAGQTLLGFAAEHGEGAVEYGRGKLERKRLDAVVVNDISAPGIGFDSHENAVTIVTAAGEREVTQADKRVVARAILDTVEALHAVPKAREGDIGGAAGSAASGRETRV
jgi:phosphopantothenoylcysteine decarboxylase/phosphopantothenate--cysteine ligase